MEKRLTKWEKKQLWIFVTAAFGLPLLMGVLMGINFYRGADVSAFPNAQMYYPAAGVMLAVLLTRKPEDRVPVKFYTGFLVLTGILMALCVASVFLPQVSMAAAVNLVLIVGSLISWVLLLLEKKEIRRKFGLSWGRGVRNAGGTQGEARQGIRPWLWILLFLFLYFLRIFLNYAVEGMPGAFFPPFANPYVWLNLALLPLNFFLVYTAFFGEEYGWRGFFQPILQKRYGKRLGVLILGVCWGLWHLPLNLFYYSPDTWLQSVDYVHRPGHFLRSGHDEDEKYMGCRDHAFSEQQPDRRHGWDRRRDQRPGDPVDRRAASSGVKRRSVCLLHSGEGLSEGKTPGELGAGKGNGTGKDAGIRKGCRIWRENRT